MEQTYLNEMNDSLASLEHNGQLKGQSIFLFGHCHATEVLADMLLARNYTVKAILDNNDSKYGMTYREVPVVSPQNILHEKKAIVCISTRFFESMKSQLRNLGFTGNIFKMVDYNTYSDYSLSPTTKRQKMDRIEAGLRIVDRLRIQYDNAYRIFCPFAALGDIYIMMSYLPEFLNKRQVQHCVIIVPGNVLKRVIGLFGAYQTEALPQRDLDAAVQSELYLHDKNSFIAHQDRPYVINLHLALHIKLIPLRTIYRAGVFGLPAGTVMKEPHCWKVFSDNRLKLGKSVILSPYAKSVTALPMALWSELAQACSKAGYNVFTNALPTEQPIPGTIRICPMIEELKSAVEQAGIFIGLRSGLCDLLITAKAMKIALYPDYNYSDTNWKAIEMYNLPEFEANLVVNAETGYIKELSKEIISLLTDVNNQK